MVEVPVVTQQVKNPTSILEDVVSIPGLAQWVKDLAWLQMWLGCGVAVTMEQAGSCTPRPLLTLAREFPYAVDVALKKKKKKKRQKEKKRN